MNARKRVTQSIKTGTLIGLAYFICDAIGALLAIGELFDPKPESVLLMGVAALFTVGPAIVVTTAWNFSVGKYIHWGKASPRAQRIACILGAIIICMLGYGLRVSRVTATVTEIEPIPATNPAPVLWVVIDTLRADTFYGPNQDFPLTPGFKTLAADFHQFTDAEAPAGWTLPSIATLMTGIHPTTLYSARGYLPNWAPTAAQRLKRAGYRTHAFMDNYLLERRNGFAAGFDSFFQKSALRFAFTFPGFRLIPTKLRETLREEFEIFYYGAESMTDEILTHMRADRKETPFYYVQYMDVHYPYYEHPEIAPDPPHVEPVQLHYAMADARDHKIVPNANQMAFLEHRYNGELQALDKHLTRLIQSFLELYGDESLIMITSDHGEEFLEHGELGHGNSLYRELVHVPLLVRLPGTMRKDTPRVDDTVVGLVDVLPTTLEVLGISAVPDTDFLGVQGESLLGWMLGTAPRPQRPLYGTQNRHQRRIYRWRTQGSAYINHYDHKAPGEPKARSELYDKSTDYNEQKNLFTVQPDQARLQQKALTKFVDEQVKDRDPKPVTTVPNIDAMKALGYIE